MCKNHHHSPVRCVVPPYMAEKLTKSTNKTVAENAINSKFRNYRFRSDREFFSLSTVKEKKVLGAISAKTSAPKKAALEIYNCKTTTNTATAKLLWKTGTKKLPADKDAKNVKTGGETTWQFYYDLFKRNSVDNLGMVLKQYIHYDKKYDNAFWDGRRMIYGDGDGKIFGSFTSDIDIIGHELTHGVTQFEANLDYEMQSGALNESFSDIFGIMIKQRYLNQDVHQSNWLIGENVLKGAKYALRSLKAPGTAYVNHPQLGTDPQPATMDKFVKLPNTDDGDYGGVHYNSGIPNYAFYVAAFNIGGYSWEKAGQIWYAALTDTENLKKDASFADLKALTVKKATSLYGTGSLEVKAVKDAWKTAKV